MKLGKSGWLENLLTEVVTLHQTNTRGTQGELTPWERRESARAYLKHQVGEGQLLFGASDEELERSSSALPFLATVRSWARMVLEVARRLEAPAGPRREQLLVLFSALVAKPATTRSVDALVRQKKPPSARLWSAVEAGLEDWVASWVGDPVHGLLLHTGVSVVDARLLGQEAVDYFLHPGFDLDRSLRRHEVASRLKAVLAETLSALIAAAQRPNATTRRTILQQVDGLHLPPSVGRALRERIQQILEGRASSQAWRTLRNPSGRRWLLSQLLLSAQVQGREAPRERAFIAEVAASLSMGPSGLAHLEHEVAVTYVGHRSLVDAFTESDRPWTRGFRLTSVQSSLNRNFERLMQEVRETGELSVLLGKVARGYRPTPEERQQMRAQLIDLAKAVPALALFAAPGGMFLLVALAKVVPFNLLPSAWQEATPAKGPRSGRKVTENPAVDRVRGKP